MKKIFFLNLIFNFALISFSQKKLIKNNFRSPLDIPILLSGNFAEIRGNHFHAGIDIKTKSRVGKKIYAVEDGYISRIKVSSVGYGNALYLTHKNGYLTVYGHLKSYNKKISNYVKNLQYKRKKFFLDNYPKKDVFPVKKGDLIAYSGNSGSSGGPHLHFEIRDKITQHPLNPLFFGFDIKDNIPPKIYSISIYPLDENSFVNGKNEMQNFKVFNKNGLLKLKINKEIKVFGKIGFAIETNDFLNNSKNICGIYSIELKIKDEIIFLHKLDEISFFQQKYINAHIDYSYKRRKGKVLQKSFLLPNQKLISYKKVKNKGVFYFDGDTTFNIKYTLKDSYENTSILEFNVKSFSNFKKIKNKKKKRIVKIMPFGKNNYFNENDIKISIPKGSLYDTLFFQYKKRDFNNYRYFSNVHFIHNGFTPLHKKMTISIKITDFKNSLKNKYLIASVGSNGRLYSVGGKFKNGFITTKVRSFGRYVVVSDTEKPNIQALNIYENADMSLSKNIRFFINDNLSGIASYEVYIDGKWILFNYDKKINLIWHEFDKEKINFGRNHKLILKVKDKRNNIKILKLNFFK